MLREKIAIQCEAISLTRDIPTGLGWMVGPFVTSIPRESLECTLKKTREAVEGNKRSLNSRRDALAAVAQEEVAFKTRRNHE